MKRSKWMEGFMKCDEIINNYGLADARFTFNGLNMRLVNPDYFIGFLDRLIHQAEIVNDNT